MLMPLRIGFCLPEVDEFLRSGRSPDAAFTPHEGEGCYLPRVRVAYALMA